MTVDITYQINKMATGNLKQALEYAAKNPNSDFARQLADHIKSGSADNEAKSLGIDLTPIKSSNIGTTLTLQPETGLKGIATGIAKGEIATVKGLADIGEKIASQTAGRVVNLVSGEGFKPTPVQDSFGNLVGSEQKVKEITTPEGTAENIGFATEKIAEFLAPSSAISKAKGVTTGLVKGTGTLSKIAKTAIGSGTEALATGAQSAIQEGEINDNVKTASLIASLFPVAGQVLKSSGSGVSKLGQKIQQSVIKPSIKDIEDGFKVDTINKFNLGGSLEQTLAKTNAKMNDLSSQLKDKLANSVIPVNLNNVYSTTEKRLLENKAGSFGNISSIQKVLNNLKNEITEVGGQNGLVDLVEANLIKRGAGTKGSWVFGNPDPDSKAVETVYNTFYNEIKKSIEQAAESSGQGGIKEINKQLSELIPVNNAVLRRIPVESRNNAIGLTDLITITGSIFDPRALVLTGVNRLSRSGQVGNLLVKAGENIKNPEVKNSVINRLLGN